MLQPLSSTDFWHVCRMAHEVPAIINELISLFVDANTDSHASSLGVHLWYTQIQLCPLAHYCDSVQKLIPNKG